MRYTVVGTASYGRLFLSITLSEERKNLQEMHFKTEGTGSTAYIRTSKVHAATGRTTKEEMTLMSIQEGK